MSRLLGLSRVIPRSVALLSSKFPSKNSTSRCIVGHLLDHTLQYTTSKRRESQRLPPKISDPLHILYCGSDALSCAVLKALYTEHVENPDLIKSIDVVVRPAKRTGRGLQKLTEPPLRSVAENRELPIHTRDTFTGWDMPAKINLIIAVSFGLFVPPRLLSAAKYGGLNIHPSLLPDLRGPAPLHHSLLNNDLITGVSLQSLHHYKFDHGFIIAQTPHDRKNPSTIRIPAHYENPATLQSLITPAAVQLLISSLRENLHVPPFKPRAEVYCIPKSEIRHAPKITKRDSQLTGDLLRQWDRNRHLSAKRPTTMVGPLVRRHRVIGPLWFLSRDRKGQQKRIIITAVEDLEPLPKGGYVPAMVDTSARATNNPRFQDWRFAIPLEEEPEDSTSSSPSPSPSSTTSSPEGRDGDTAQNPSAQPKQPMYLVFWAPWDSSTRSPSLDRDPAYSDSEGERALYLGPYRVMSLKVEGDKSKPAWDALQNFVVDAENRQAYHKRKEAVRWVLSRLWDDDLSDYSIAQLAKMVEDESTSSSF
ncbi:formyl transferase [Xylaria arbuscula]|nr:formyl transferase [Xylaria arbuscula]